MRPADFLSTRIEPLAPTSATRPTAPIGGGGGFGAMFSEVQGEVAAYIQSGDSGFGEVGNGGASALSAEGALLRARANGLIMGAEETEEAESVVPMGGAALESPQQRAFLESIAPWAREAADQLGVAPELVSAHAALESGWGQRPLRTAGGASSHNLFGIKAGPGWKGKVATSVTTEYVNGRPHTKVEKFRAYDSPAESFKDYANMLAKNPRYEKVLDSGGDAAAFAHGLQRAGYATDPQYAAKLTRIIKHSLA